MRWLRNYLDGLNAASLWRLFTKRLWGRPALYCFAAAGVVFLASVTDSFIHEIPFVSVPREVVHDLLSIIATSMLSVTIFAVSVLTAAYSSAISSTTPRAFEMVIADNSTKQALSSFIGAFIFAVIGLIGINFQSFGQPGLIIMFVMTIGVFVWVIGTLIYWIDYVTRLGQMRFTLTNVTLGAETVIAKYLNNPAQGATAVAQNHSPPLGAAPIKSGQGGVIQSINVERLIRVAESQEIEIDLALRTGAIVGVNDVVCHVSGKVPDEELSLSLQSCFRVTSERDPHQDPELSIRLLSEIADRALSPGINDPGTATDVLDAVTWLLSRAFEEASNQEENQAPNAHVRIPILSEEALIGAAFEQIGRDGAGLVEVSERLQKSLQCLSQAAPKAYVDACRLHADRALQRALNALECDWERERVRAAGAWTQE